MKHLELVFLLCLCVAVPAAAQIDDCNLACFGQPTALCDMIHAQHVCNSDCANWAGNPDYNGCSGGQRPVIVGRGTCQIDPDFHRRYSGELHTDSDGTLHIQAHFSCGANSHGYDVSITATGESAYGNFGSYGATAHNSLGGSETFSCSGSLLQHTTCPPKGSCQITTTGN